MKVAGVVEQQNCRFALPQTKAFAVTALRGAMTTPCCDTVHAMQRPIRDELKRGALIFESFSAVGGGCDNMLSHRVGEWLCRASSIAEFW